MFNFKFILLITTGLQHVSGHGYAYSPRTRNWFAVEEGAEGQSVEGLPNKEYCPDVSEEYNTMSSRISFRLILFNISFPNLVFASPSVLEYQ